MVDTNEGHATRRGRMEICTGPERRRRWSGEDKGRIVAEAVAPGAVIAQVARRHDLTPQHLSNWIRAAKDGHFALPAETAFVPVVTQAAMPVPAERARPAERAPIEITLGKIRVAVRAGADAKTLEAVLAALRRAAS
jgi:transposase